MLAELFVISTKHFHMILEYVFAQSGTISSTEYAAHVDIDNYIIQTVNSAFLGAELLNIST
jgi:hypothetical protein